MSIRRVWIEEGCTACGMCEDECPEVFEVTDETAIVKEDVDFSEYEEDIISAVEGCPVQVIQYEED